VLPLPQGADGPSEAPGAPLRTEEEQTVIRVLQGYKQEAEEARRTGENPRDPTWEENIRRYWLRHDFSGKAAWQSRERPPEFPRFVDRFAAALKEALAATGEAFYTVIDPADTEGDLTQAVKRMTDVWLSTCGTSPQGQPLSFEAVFEDQMKMACLMASCSTALWREDTAFGRVAVESVDPRLVWIDHTGRNLYRRRKIEIDRHRLEELARMSDGKGRPLYNLSEIEHLQSTLWQDEQKKLDDLSGTSGELTSTRQPVVLDEFLADIIAPGGKLIASRALTILANDKYVIRGPEENPFWHGRDWITFAPLVSVPLSVYGRSYAEDFGHMSDTFTKLTNLLLDAVTVSAMKIFAIVPEMLADPSQAETGISPGKLFKLELGMGRPQDFMHSIDMGALGQDTVHAWQLIKSELTEAADINEIGLGNFAPKSRTSATEISSTMQSSSAMVRSIAQGIEQRWLEPTLDLVWKTGLQHVRKGDRLITAAAGEEMFGALVGNRRDLIKRPVTFQARGISTLIQKSQKLQMLMQLLQVIASNEMLLQQFMQVADMGKLVDLLFDLSNIDMRRLEVSDRERMAQGLVQAAQQGMGGAAPAPAPEGAGQVAEMMGVARG
jgi:hypothetical protein